MTQLEQLDSRNENRPDASKTHEDSDIKIVFSRQTFVDAGKKGGSSRKRKERINERNRKLLEEAQDMLDRGDELAHILFYMHCKYGNEKGFPSSERQYRNILRDLKSG